MQSTTAIRWGDAEGCNCKSIGEQSEYILADESTGSLDIENRDKIMELLKSINKEQGSTIIMVTHDMELLKYASRVISL